MLFCADTGAARAPAPLAGKRFKWPRCLPELLWAAAVVGFAVYLGCERTVTLSYVSVNGDFQSYNVFRRLLAGQRPYRDFANYIGMAPVLLCQWLVTLLGGSFKASLFATNCITCVIFCMAGWLLLRLAGAGRLPALLVSCALPKFISTQILCALPGRFWADLNARFTGLYTPSNSMRMARCFLPFLLAGAAAALAHWRGLELLDLFRTPARCAVCGGVLGLCMVWSSDYSLACLAAAGVILLLLHLCRYRAGWRRFALCLACYGLCAAVGAQAAAALVTGGQPGAFWRSMAATGGAQSYYFNGIFETPLLVYLFTCWQFWCWAAPFLVFLLWQTVRLARERLPGRELPLYFLCASILAATLGYILTGSGHNCREPLEVFTVLLLAGAALRAVRHWVTPRPARCGRALTAAALALAAVYLVGQGTLAACGYTRAQAEGNVVPALGGPAPYPLALEQAADLTAGGEVFSLYATGLEVVKSTFQPSGYDYIIHALGPDAQAAYRQCFADGGYPWVQTPCLPTDAWLALENWYFYRDLLAGYRRALRTEYSWLWQRCGDETLPAEVSVTVSDNGDGSFTVACESEEHSAFIADVALTWDSDFTSPGAALLELGRRGVEVRTGALYADEPSCAEQFLPGSGTGWAPVLMEDGRGSLTVRGRTAGTAVTACTARFCRALPRPLLYE